MKERIGRLISRVKNRDRYNILDQAGSDASRVYLVALDKAMSLPYDSFWEFEEMPAYSKERVTESLKSEIYSLGDGHLAERVIDLNQNKKRLKKLTGEIVLIKR